jgi:hypothetical protein
MRGKRDAMPDPASRRRRSSSPPPARGGGTGGGPLPTAALAIGVVVAGLGIGALISAFQNRGAVPQLGATSVPAVTPVPQPSPASPFPTLAPTAAPSPSPAPTPSAAVKPSPAPRRSPAPPSPTPAATTAALASPIALASAAPSPRPQPTAKPSPVAVPTAAPTVRPVASASPARAAAGGAQGDPDVALVRRYIQNLIAGDETAAYAALGGTSSDRNLDLKEEAFLDKDARLTSIRVSRSDASGVTIDADITSGSGSYVATFRVANGPNGPTIAQHDFIKV